LARKDEGPHAVNPECEESLVLQRGEIAFVDHQFGRLMAALSRRDPGLERTAVVVVADHGECFGEGQEVPELFGEGGIKVLHVPSLYEATQHVVCVIEPPAALRGAAIGRRNHSPASHLDLYPTLAMLAGQSIPSGLQGRSLLPALRGEELPDRPLYMEAFGATNQDQRDDRLQAILEGGWKYVRTVDRRMEFLYSLADGDAVDHAKDQPERLARMREKLEELFRGLEEVHSVSAATTAPGLGALGYVGGDDEDR